MSTPDVTFTQVSELDTAGSTLIEGLPGHGLVAAIAVDQITDQLGLQHYGTIDSDAFPPVTTFEDGLVKDLVRVYAGTDPAVMTLKSDLALPQQAIEPLSTAVLSDLADRFEQAIFLAGAPAESEEDLGTVTGVGTTPRMKEQLQTAGITISEDHGVVGGITGALVQECYRADIPAALLIVRSHPQLPDPQAARSVIETALEPLVDFDIETQQLQEQADEIQRQLRQIAEQHQQLQQQQAEPQTVAPGMFQ